MSIIANLFFVIFGLLGGLGVGWYFWKRTQALLIDENTSEQVIAPTVEGKSGVLDEAIDERDYLNAQFDLLLSKLNDESKSNWQNLSQGGLGDTQTLLAEKKRLAAKIKEFVGKVDPQTRRYVSSLEEESLGVISPIKEQLESEEKSRIEVQNSFDQLVAKLDPDLQKEWKGLGEGSVGISAPTTEWEDKFTALLEKISPDVSNWEGLEKGALGVKSDSFAEETPLAITPRRETLETADWTRSEVFQGPTWLLDAPGTTPDNLKKIWGIGPVLEKTLNDIGIYYFSQLAQLSSTEDIAWVSEHINTFPDRISRDQWNIQAEKLVEDPNAIMEKPTA